MPIRPATPDDAIAITAIYNDAIENTTAVLWHEPKPATQWQDRLADLSDKYPVLVAQEPTGQIMGFAGLFTYDSKCGYDDVAEWSVYIAPTCRGRGVGRALAEALINTAREKARSGDGLHSIVSRVTAGNTASAHLHDRLGFRVVGTFKRLGHKFGQRHDVIAYQLIL